LLILFFPSSVFSQDPGGHSPNLNLWLKANVGTSSTLDGATQDGWEDQSLNSYNAVQTITTQKPIFHNNLTDNINYNEVVTFDGTSDNFDLPISSAPEINENYSVFIVAQTHSTGTTRSMYSLNHNFPNRSSRWRIESTGTLSDQWGSNIILAPVVTVGQNYIHASSYDNTVGREMFFDGYSVGTNPSIVHNALNSFGTYVGAMSINGTPIQFWEGDIAEVIHFKEDLSAMERKKVNSYLAIKYGITIPNTGGGTQGDYLATNALIIWVANLSSGYHNNVIGIGRDDAEGLIQKQSHTIDDTTRVYLNTLEAINDANSGGFISDGSYLVMGNDSGLMCSTVASNMEVPATLMLTARLEREWKVTKTNMNENFNWDLTLNGCTDFPITTVNDLRLLIDDDGDFTDATAYAASGTLSFVVSGNTVSVMGISDTHIPNSSTKYMTIAIVTDPIAEFTLSDTVICLGDSITVTDISTGTNIYQWNWIFQNGTPETADSQGSHVINFTAAGIYDIMLQIQDENGTDDTIVTVTVTGLPLIDAGVNQTICTGDSVTLTANNISGGVISWDNNVNDNIVFTPLDTMTYMITSVLNGCFNTDSVSVNVNPVPLIEAGVNQTICNGDQVVLTANNTNGGIISWDNNVIDNIAFTPLDSILYTVTSVLNGCSNTDSVSVNVEPIPVIEAGVNQTICSGGIVTLTANNISGGVISWNNNVINSIAFTPLNTMTYTVTSVLNGCMNTDSVSVNVNPLPLINAGEDQSICSGDSVTLTAINTSGGIISWDNDVNDNVVFNPLTTIVYTVISVVNGCSNSDSVQVLINPIPIVDAGQNQVICSGDPVVLVANNISEGVISWDNDVNDNVVFYPVTTSDYIVTSVLNDCSISDTIEIQVNILPLVDAGSDQVVCVGDQVILVANNLNGGLISWDSGVNDSIMFVPLNTFIYTVTVSLNGCSATDDVLVTVNEFPSAEFTFSPVVPTVEGTQVHFAPLFVNSNYQFQWNFGNGLYSTIENPTTEYPELLNVSYEIELIVIDANGCSDTITNVVEVADVLNYFVPNAFTPDADQINTTFQPVFTSGFYPQDYHLVIFNRWGEIIFESFNNNLGWDGTYINGTPVQDGVYVYLIEFGELLTDKRNKLYGHVTVIK